MGALKRLSVNTIEANRMKYQRMDALQLSDLIYEAVEAAIIKLDKKFPGRNCGGIKDQMIGELLTFVDGQLERRFGE